jgi:TolB-like protein/Flp pilus assembly protein TadD/DNA-binding winged helix-turn-helix (wHTH) protein
MMASSLQNGFRIGDWRIEPAALRASTPDTSRELTPDQLRLLLLLAERHGEAVDRRELRQALWPDQQGSESRLRETLAALRAQLGDSPRHPRYLAAVGSDALALIGPFAIEAAVDAPAAAEPGRLHTLLGELRRRNVYKVAASYLVGMWIVLQVAETTFEPLRFPDWWLTALTIIAIIGLPIVAVLAWTYEITPQGVVVDAGPPVPGARPRLPRARLSIAPFIVAGVALMAAVTGLAWWRSIALPPDAATAVSTAPEPGSRSIAVLPLVDMSASGGNAYLGDGLSEELSTRLAQVPGLRVAARTSAFEFRGRNLDVRRIGQSLGVRHVLEGSVRRDGDNVRVTVQLIDTRTGYHVWAGNFDRAWREVLMLQDDIARSVTDALQVVLAERPARAALGEPHQLDVRAIEPYLAGLAALRQPGDASLLKRAQQSFRDAIAIDPQFAGAYAGLCRVLGRTFERSGDPQLLEDAAAACRTSLALDPTLLDTEKALANIALSRGRHDEAAAAFRRLLQRGNRQDADLHVGLGEALAGQGQGAEAEASYRRAVAAEPAYWSAHSALGTYLWQRGKLDEAAAAMRKAAELVPSSANAWSNVGGVLQMKGDFDGALQAYRRSLQLEPSKEGYSNLGTTLYYLNRFPEAVGNFERAAELGPFDYTVQGNLADALWQVPARRADAVARYQRATLLAEKQLEATPGDPTLRAQLGYFYSRAGDAGRSVRYLSEALEAGPDLLYVHYFAGVAAADRGDRAAALSAVAELVRLGYPPSLLRSAPEFHGLLQDAGYRKIVGTAAQASP